MSKKIQNWILVIIWAGFIFFLSHQPGLKSGLANEWDFVLRKIAHITEYAVLTWLLIRALKGCRISHKKVLIWSFSLVLLFSISDEYHQTFVIERHGAWSDVLIDGLGIILAIWIKKEPKT